jgi:hypothetical protein
METRLQTASMVAHSTQTKSQREFAAAAFLIPIAMEIRYPTALMAAH